MKAKVLVVDDERPILMLTSELLLRDHLDVTCAQTLSIALGHLRTTNYDLVLTDFRLSPTETGEDIVKAVKLLQPSTPILILTADPGALPAWLCDGKAVYKVLTKPCGGRDLLDSVRQGLALSQPKPAEAPLHVLPRGIEAMVHRVVDQESIIAITDKKGMIVYANDRFCEISGYSRLELLGQNHRILKSGMHTPAFYKGLWGNILNGKTWQGEICNRAKDGHLYYVDTTIAPLREEGLITHFLAIRTDITARKEAQLALEEQGKREENDRKMAALGRMADGFLHDLSNILTGVMGLASDKDNARRDELLHDAIGRMAQLTRTLRDFSAGRPTKPVEFALNPLVACACSLARHRSGTPRSLKILDQLEVTEGTMVLGNEGQIFEVVLNLLVNAVEATESCPHPQILVRTKLVEGRVQLLVEDNGPGVPASVAGTIFEPFSSTKGVGRGIGLSVSRSIVATHGGELSLLRAGGDGHGACFELLIPWVKTKLDVRTPKDPQPIVSQKRIVLVSEDEAEVRRMLSNDINRAGFTMIHSEDLADLLAMASKMKEVLAAAILDSCGVKSDNEAIACLRRVAPNLPIILISGSLKDRGLLSTPWGDVESIPKPLDSEAIVKALSSPCVNS